MEETFKVWELDVSKIPHWKWADLVDEFHKQFGNDIYDAGEFIGVSISAVVKKSDKDIDTNE